MLYNHSDLHSIILHITKNAYPGRSETENRRNGLFRY